MTTSLLQRSSLMAISPVALSGFARSLNWVKSRTYREYSDVYEGEGLPGIVVPNSLVIDDYAFVIGRLIQTFSAVTDRNFQSIYRDLVNADRDVIRVRVPEVDEDSLTIGEGLSLVNGARDALLASACSFEDRRAVYRAGANQAALEYLRRVRLGHTEEGSFTVALLPPVIPPTIDSTPGGGGREMAGYQPDEPLERRMTGHFAGTVAAVRKATGDTVSGSASAFANSVSLGVSANFCEAMVGMIGSFSQVDVSVSWALTRPLSVGRSSFSFFQDDSPVLRAAADSFRSRGPKHDVRLFGKVGRLVRGDEEEGRVTLRTLIEGRSQSVNALLNWEDYEKAIVAHRGKVVLGLEGDLERVGQRWHIRNPRVIEVISLDDADDDSGDDSVALP